MGAAFARIARVTTAARTLAIHIGLIPRWSVGGMAVAILFIRAWGRGAY